MEETLKQYVEIRNEGYNRGKKLSARVGVYYHALGVQHPPQAIQEMVKDEYRILDTRLKNMQCEYEITSFYSLPTLYLFHQPLSRLLTFTIPFSLPIQLLIIATHQQPKYEHKIILTHQIYGMYLALYFALVPDNLIYPSNET